jgi:CubicO group peptidase (beta-lactamase class C family)
MNRSIFLASGIFLSGFFAAGAYADMALQERIEAAVPEAFSGQIVIGNAEGVLYSGNFGYADREARIPVTANTLFDIGSVTKTYTATAVLLLAAENKLGVDMTLSHWFADSPETTGAITLHQLLSHSSGLPLYSGDDDAACDRSCFDRWLQTVTLEFSPGEKYQYSNPGYSALARIIEKVSGRVYETFIAETLVQPLAAGPIGYLKLPAEASYAVGYEDGRRMGIPPEMGWMDDGPPWHLRGNGGLLTTASGLYRWLQATAAGKTLPAEWQAKQLLRHAERSEGIWYGYGWVIIEKPWGEEIDHTGGNDFFFADARWFRESGLLLTITNNAFDQAQIQALLNNLRVALGLVTP